MVSCIKRLSLYVYVPPELRYLQGVLFNCQQMSQCDERGLIHYKRAMLHLPHIELYNRSRLGEGRVGVQAAHRFAVRNHRQLRASDGNDSDKHEANRETYRSSTWRLS